MDYLKADARIARLLLVLALSSLLPVTLTGCAGFPPAAPATLKTEAATPRNTVSGAHYPEPGDRGPRRSVNGSRPANVAVGPLEIEFNRESLPDKTPLGPDFVDLGRSRLETTSEVTDPSADAVSEPTPVGTVTAPAVSGIADDADEFATEEVPSEEDAAAPTRYADVWGRIRNGFRMPPFYDPRVAYHERWFANKRKYIARKFERARLYLYHIVEEVERRGLPMEIALLPAIESAYHPHAYSRARAVGLWQFIAPTARRYGLKISWWYDGRRDIVASTTAALNYLEELYQDFDGDWYLALAAYNAGEGRIKRAIQYNQRKGLPTHYAALRLLRQETRHYVPKLMAIVNIISDPEAYGITLAPIPNEPYFARVDLGSQIDLGVVAKLADVPIGDFYDINPGFSRWATDPGGPHQVLVPVNRQERLLEGLENLPEQARIKWRRYRVRRGDTLSTIARRYGVSVWAIRKTNNLRGNLIRVGQNLMIPISSRSLSKRVANMTRPLPSTSLRPHGRTKIIHRVRKGETLWSIARKYRVYVHQLARWNSMHPRDTLRIGMKLKVWISPRHLSSITLSDRMSSV